MSSSGTPTPNYNLNQWQASDKPERMDFNSDNQKIDAALLNKAKGNPATGDALNAEKLGGISAGEYPKQQIVDWMPKLTGSNGVEISITRTNGRAVITGGVATFIFDFTIENLNGATGDLTLSGFPFIIDFGMDFPSGGYFNNMNTSLYSSYFCASVNNGTGIVFRPVKVLGVTSNADTIKTSDVKASTILRGSSTVIIKQGKPEY